MSMRSTFGILALTGVLASAPASILSYRATGQFDDASGGFALLIGTTFTYDFSYDTDAINLGDASGAADAMLAVVLDGKSALIEALGKVAGDSRSGS